MKKKDVLVLDAYEIFPLQPNACHHQPLLPHATQACKDAEVSSKRVA